jgi:hypothetical protein
MSTKTYLCIHIYLILYSSFSLSIHLPVKLPTIALIDIEAAEEFLNNIVPGLYLEVPYNWEGFIHMYIHTYEYICIYMYVYMYINIHI